MNRTKSILFALCLGCLPVVLQAAEPWSLKKCIQHAVANNLDVITSYSIHYTKLYDVSRPEIELEIDYRLKALSLDRLNESSESYYQSMGKIFNDIDWQLAGKYYKKSIESGFVSRYTTNEQYQIEYRSRNFGEALRYALKTLDLAPGRLQSNMDVAFSYLQNHQFRNNFV